MNEYKFDYNKLRTLANDKFGNMQAASLAGGWEVGKIATIVRRKSAVSHETLMKFCDLFNVNTDYFKVEEPKPITIGEPEAKYLTEIGELKQMMHELIEIAKKILENKSANTPQKYAQPPRTRKNKHV